MATHDFTGSICARAWSNIEIDAKGTIRPCCQYQSILTDHIGTPLNVVDTTIQEIQNCDDIKQLRAMMLQGEKSSACAKCWQDEEAGKQISPRQHANSMLTVDARALGTRPGVVQSMGMALGNICNLKCRICGPWASSAWAVDEIKRLGREHSQQEQDMLEQGRWPRRSRNFWQEFEERLPSIQELDFYGGEPFLSPQHLEILQRVVESGHNQNLSIKYTTNATVFPERFVDTFRKFKRVQIQFSIDDVGARFEYQRKNALWQTVLEVVHQFRALGNLHLRINCAVSVYNALYLQEILLEFKTLWPWLPYQLDVVVLDQYHSIKYMPRHFKDLVAARIDMSRHDENAQKNLQYVINQMYSCDSIDQCWTDLKQAVQTIDQFRRERLRQSHPELADCLET